MGVAGPIACFLFLQMECLQVSTALAAAVTSPSSVRSVFRRTASKWVVNDRTIHPSAPTTSLTDIAPPTKSESDTHAPAAHMCNLSTISDRTFFFSMVRSTEHILLHHFLLHYSTLGLDLSRKAQFLVHKVDDISFEEVKAIMVKHKVPLENIIVSEVYHSHVKRDAVNSFIRSLPTDAWVVYPDLDEFFEYPCTILDPHDQVEIFTGVMADRIGPAFTLPSISLGQPIEEQLPLSCPGLRSKLPSNPWDFKVILFKAFSKGRPRQFANSHEIAKRLLDIEWGDVIELDELSNGFEELPRSLALTGERVYGNIVHLNVFFPHYFWTAQAFSDIRSKMEVYDESDGRHLFYKAMLSLFESSGKDLSTSGRELLGKYCQ